MLQGSRQAKVLTKNLSVPTSSTAAMVSFPLPVSVPRCLLPHPCAMPAGMAARGLWAALRSCERLAILVPVAQLFPLHLSQNKTPQSSGAYQAPPSLSTVLSYKWHSQLSTLSLDACREQAVLALPIPAGGAGSNSRISLHIPLQLILCLLYTPGEDQGWGANVEV